MNVISVLTLLICILLAASCGASQAPAGHADMTTPPGADAAKLLASRTWLSVVNVTKDDVLNLRQEASGKSTLVFEIPHDAVNLLKIAQSDQWVKVQFRGYVGWVHGNYVKDHQHTNTSTLFGGELFCLGTEPHWNLKTKGAQTSFRLLGNEASLLSNDKVRVGTNQNNHWLLSLSKEDNPLYGYDAIIEKRECNDGMSDNTYPFNINVIGKMPPQLLGGCCKIIPLN